MFSSFDRPQTELYRCYRYYYLLPLYVASSVGGKSRDLRNTLGETHYMLTDTKSQKHRLGMNKLGQYSIKIAPLIGVKCDVDLIKQ